MKCVVVVVQDRDDVHTLFIILNTKLSFTNITGRADIYNRTFRTPKITKLELPFWYVSLNVLYEYRRNAADILQQY
jgi:hypothetical protein